MARNSHLCGQVTRGTGPLADHTHTVESYLNDYIANPTKQCFFSLKFNYYLTAVCWKKMYRRIKAWTALGFLHSLHRCRTSGEVQTLISLFDWKKPPRPQFVLGPSDLTLIRYLNETKDIGEDMSAQAPYAVNEDLLKDFLKHAEQSLTDKKPIYTRYTALGFHELACNRTYPLWNRAGASPSII